MAPNLAQGANCSIEDAASLANILYDALRTADHPRRLSSREIEHHLRRFNKEQTDRMVGIYKASQAVVRLQTRSNLFWKLILRYYVPYAGNEPTERALRLLEGAVALSFIPLPQRSGPRWLLPRKKPTNIFVWVGAALAVLTIASMW
jgi:salicylate hydroxylase/FAD dependent monooxygenase